MKRLQVEEVESISAQRPAAVMLPTYLTHTQSFEPSSSVSVNCAYFLK